MAGAPARLAHLEVRNGELHRELLELKARLDLVREGLGRIELRQTSMLPAHDLTAHEFRVYSQWGEDGIIQFLIQHVPIQNKIFVEFGVEDYFEANTRFLLVNDNWSGLVMEGQSESIKKIRQNRVFWNYDLRAVQAFVTRDNINELLSEQGIHGNIGLLSIDVDGNDYWIWRAIHVIQPAIVIVEYNYRFGPDVALSIPYQESFVIAETPPRAFYYGAALGALCHLANQKGYAFVGCSSNGVNAFFIKRELKPDFIPELLPAEGYRTGKFSGVRNPQGHESRVSPAAEMEMLAGLGLPLVDVIAAND